MSKKPNKRRKNMRCTHGCLMVIDSMWRHLEVKTVSSVNKSTRFNFHVLKRRFMSHSTIIQSKLIFKLSLI